MATGKINTGVSPEDTSYTLLSPLRKDLWAALFILILQHVTSQETFGISFSIVCVITAKQAAS